MYLSCTCNSLAIELNRFRYIVTKLSILSVCNKYYVNVLVELFDVHVAHCSVNCSKNFMVRELAYKVCTMAA